MKKQVVMIQFKTIIKFKFIKNNTKEIAYFMMFYMQLILKSNHMLFVFLKMTIIQNNF